MGFKYLTVKGIGKVGHIKGKTKKEWFFEQHHVHSILKEVEKSKDEFNTQYLRDYAILYLAYSLGLRVGEVILLERRHFKDLLDGETVRLPTLKKSQKIRYRCMGPDCSRTVRVRGDRAGQDFTCVRCGHIGVIPIPDTPVNKDIPEEDLPFIEEDTIAFVTQYMQQMRPNQTFFFESPKNKEKHLSKSSAVRILYTFVHRAGLSNHFSFHGLRHGRGRRIYAQMRDHQSVMQGLRHSSLEMSKRYASLDEEMIKEAKMKLKKSATFSPITIGAAKK